MCIHSFPVNKHFNLIEFLVLISFPLFDSLFRLKFSEHVIIILNTFISRQHQQILEVN